MTLQATVRYLVEAKTPKALFDLARNYGQVAPHQCYTIIPTPFDVVLDDAYALTDHHDAKEGMRVQALEDLCASMAHGLKDASGDPIMPLSVGDLVMLDGFGYVVKALGFSMYSFPFQELEEKSKKIG